MNGLATQSPEEEGLAPEPHIIEGWGVIWGVMEGRIPSERGSE